MRALIPLVVTLAVALVRFSLAFPGECQAAQQVDCPLVKCNDNDLAKGGGEGTFTGLYTLGFEMSKFVPSGSDCQWWLSGDTTAIWVAMHSPQGMESATVRVRVQGAVSQPGCYGHMGMYRRELNVTRILSAEVQDPKRHEWVPLPLPVLPSPTLPGPLPPEKLRR